MSSWLVVVAPGLLAAAAVWYAQRWDDRRIRERQAAVDAVWIEAMRQVRIGAVQASQAMNAQVVPALVAAGEAITEFAAIWSAAEIEDMRAEVHDRLGNLG